MYENLALSDNGFLFDTRTGSTYSLSRTGTFLLRQLMTGTGVDSLPGRLVETYEVDDDTAARDVEQFVFRLRDMRVIDADGRTL